jgi:hypothetical protein
MCSFMPKVPGQIKMVDICVSSLKLARYPEHSAPQETADVMPFCYCICTPDLMMSSATIV